CARMLRSPLQCKMPEKDWQFAIGVVFAAFAIELRKWIIEDGDENNRFKNYPNCHVKTNCSEVRMLSSLLVGALLSVGQTGTPPSETRIYAPTWNQSVPAVGPDGRLPSDHKHVKDEKVGSAARGDAELPKGVIILTQGGGVSTPAPQASPSEGPASTLSL